MNMTTNTTLEEQPEWKNVHLVCGQPDEDYYLALIVKRTYQILPNGTCKKLDIKEQEPVYEDSEVYEQVEAPLVSPTRQDNDCFAFKQATDVIVQGSAYAYKNACTSMVVTVKFRDIERQIRVFGDRCCDWNYDKRLRFTDPEPFERMPLRYDRAYGGQDKVALKRYGDPVVETMGSVRPEWNLEANSPYHYLRNPSGMGYIVQLDKESTENLQVPNLEFLFDPVTPERIAVSEPDKWMNGPLPACFDWCDQSWFPRIAYLGVLPSFPVEQKPLEIAQGWSEPDLLSSASILDLNFRPEFLQGASAGLAVKGVRPNEMFFFENLFPQFPEVTVQLPGEIPEVSITPKWKDERSMESHLNTIVFRPDDWKVILTWSCRAKVHRPYTPDELRKTPFKLFWKNL
jgi:hypothetical protein